MIDKKPAIYQFMGVTSYGDAIGNMALKHMSELRGAGYRSEIFSAKIHPELFDRVKTLKEYDEISKPDDIIVYHLSLGSPVSDYVKKLKKRLILYYHNITPPYFFARFKTTLMKSLMMQCIEGREELKSFKSYTAMAIADSDFNRRELEEIGFSRTATVPVPVDFSTSQSMPDPVIKNLYDDSIKNLLFVGRIVPNKKIEDAIRLFAIYHAFYNPKSRLIIVGAYSGFEEYLTWLRRFARELGVFRDVIFTGHVSNAGLSAYYKVSDLFLMMSEHEGFCVPLIEAFASGIPVLAYDGGAIGETMNGGGILLSNKDYELASELIHEVISNQNYRKLILASQEEALKKYKSEKLKVNLITTIEKIM